MQTLNPEYFSQADIDTQEFFLHSADMQLCQKHKKYLSVIKAF